MQQSVVARTARSLAHVALSTCGLICIRPTRAMRMRCSWATSTWPWAVGLIGVSRMVRCISAQSGINSTEKILLCTERLGDQHRPRRCMQ